MMNTKRIIQCLFTFLLLISTSTLLASPPATNDRVLPPFDYNYWGDYHFDTKVSNIVAQKWVEKDHTIEGWDFSLPPKLKPSEKSVLTATRTMHLKQKVMPAGKVRFSSNIACEKWVTWKDIEPVEGQFRWDLIKESIEETQKQGYEVVLRILTAAHTRQGKPELGYAPTWLKKYNIPDISFDGVGNLTIGGGSQCYDPAHPDFHLRYLRLIKEFGKSGIPEMLKAAYTGYASKSHGEEGMGPIGKNPDDFPHIKERLDMWANAFEGMEYKVYMGGPSHYGFDLGFGVRRGFVEMYWYTIPDNIIGQHVDNAGYLYVDEESPILKSGAFNGEVNEEYESDWATEKFKFRFGKTTDSFNYRYFMSMLRSLQMRCTSIVLHGNLIPEMVPFISQELARTVEDTPDIWSFMTQTTLQADRFEGTNHEGFSVESNRDISAFDRKNGIEVKNFERWLYQRDQPGFETTPAKKIQHPIKMWMIQPDKYYDYIAREGAQIGFYADDRFDVGGKAKSIKVSYFDDYQGKMYLRYRDSKGGLHTKELSLKGDGALRTSTFIIEDIALAGAQGEFDFTLHAAEGAEKICVSMVRVAKLK